MSAIAVVVNLRCHELTIDREARGGGKGLSNDDWYRRPHQSCLPSSKSTTSTPGSVARGRSRSMCGRLWRSASNGTIPTWPTVIRNTSARAANRVVSPPVHEVLPVAETSQPEMFLQHLRRHERRETTYLEM